MKNYFKKFSIMFVMALILILGCSTSVFATDDGVVGTANLNSTTENSATVGVTLIAPEKGWKRYDDRDSKILYVGKWMDINNASLYKGTYKQNITNEASATIKFYGTKFRLITFLSYDHINNVDIKVDNVPYSYNEYSTTVISQAVGFQLLKLPLGYHTITITNSGTSGIFNVLDAIDIDDTGYLVNPNESIDVDKSSTDLTLGDSEKLTATTTPAGLDVVWSSSDESVATVDQNGNVTAVGEGTCNITATINDGSNLSDSCIVNVKKKDIPTPDNPTDSKTGAILIINLNDGETKVFDVSSSEIAKFKSWYNNKSEYESKLTYEFAKTVNSNISVEEYIVHEKITSFEIRKY